MGAESSSNPGGRGVRTSKREGSNDDDMGGWVGNTGMGEIGMDETKYSLVWMSLASRCFFFGTTNRQVNQRRVEWSEKWKECGARLGDTQK